MAEAEFLNDPHVGRFPIRDVALTASGGEFEFGEVAAGEVIAHVGGGEADFAVEGCIGEAYLFDEIWASGVAIRNN